MDQDPRELLSAFNDHKVKYLVIGAYALGVHAEPHATKDLDVFIKADFENSNAVFCALAAFGVTLYGISPSDFDKGNGPIFQMGQPPLRVDILPKIDGVSFDQAWLNRVETLIDGDLFPHTSSLPST